MSYPAKKIRIHDFCGLIGLATDKRTQQYLTPEDALAVARELTRFAKNIQSKENSIATRNVENGKATTESTGKRKVEYMQWG